MKSSKASQGASIDWKRVRQRLAVVEKALESGFAPTEEQRLAILQARARALASEPPAAAAPGADIEVLEFVLAQERYALETAWIHEVYPLKELTPLPCAPAFVLGIVNVRGRIVSVLDLKVFFDLPGAGLTDLNKLIILRDGAMEFGLLADQILGVRWLPTVQIQPPLPTLIGIRADYLKGVTRERLVVLDAAKLLIDRSITVNEEVAL